MELRLLRQLAASLAGLRRVALVTVYQTQGSAPRHSGASMLVRPDGTIEGTVGGGRVEAIARMAALEALAAGASRIVTAEMLGEGALSTDMICGGLSRMYIELVGGDSPYLALIAEADEGRPCLIERRLPRGRGDGTFEAEGRAFVDRGGRLVACGAGGATAGEAMTAPGANQDLIRTCLAKGESRSDEAAGLFIDPLVPEERLLIVGGGHVGLALARLARELDFAVTVVDDRPEFADAARFPAGVSTRSGELVAELGAYRVDAGTYAVIATRGHLSDLECVRALAGRGAAYLGFIGSSRKTRLILEQLRTEGLDPALIDAIHAPIGLDLAAETPAEIGLSILAQMIAVRRKAPLLATGGMRRR